MLRDPPQRNYGTRKMAVVTALLANALPAAAHRSTARNSIHLMKGKTMMRTSVIAAAAAVLLAAPAAATVRYLSFEGLLPYPMPAPLDYYVKVGEYYSGKRTNLAYLPPGPDYGITFGRVVLLVCLTTPSYDCGGNADYAFTSKGGQGIPGSEGYGIAFVIDPFIVNVRDGFDTAFSGTYTSQFEGSATISIYSELNGGGTLLAQKTLGNTMSGCDPAYGSPEPWGFIYCPFDTFSLAFGGTAKSLVFSGALDPVRFDDFTFGSAIPGPQRPDPGPVPEPTTWAMLIAGFGLVGLAARRRRVRGAA